MTLIELKKSIHKKVDDLNDRELLELVDAIVNRKGEVFVIPEHMKEGIRQGMEDIKNGDFYTMEDFEKKYEKWLKE
jgi:predicted transcriptional regulator